MTQIAGFVCLFIKHGIVSFERNAVRAHESIETSFKKDKSDRCRLAVWQPFDIKTVKTVNFRVFLEKSAARC